MSSSSPYPPLEKALRLIKKEHVENSWCNVTGKVDTVLELLKQAEEEGMEWGKPVYDPLAYTDDPTIYENADEFIAKHLDPYVERHSHLQGYIKTYPQKAYSRLKKCHSPGRPPTIDKAKVIELRKQGMTQQAIADELGVSQKTVSNVLSSNNHDNVIIITRTAEGDTKPTEKQGNSVDYWIQRTKRDYPEAYENDEVGKGKKYPTARALAIAMGDIVPDITIKIKPNETGSQIAGRLYQKLSDEQLIELRDALNDFLGGQTNG